MPYRRIIISRRNTCALMIAAAMQLAAPSVFSESIIVGDDENVTAEKTVLTSLVVESRGAFTNIGALRLEGDAVSRLSGSPINIDNILALNDGATLILDTPDALGTSDVPSLVLSTDDNTSLNDAITKLIVNADTSLVQPRGIASLLAGENAEIEIDDGTTLEIKRGVANIRGTLSGNGTLSFIDSDKNFIENPNGRESTHTGEVIVDEASLRLGEGALANSSSVTFRNNRTDLANISRTSTADADSLKNGVNLTIENDAFLELDGNNKTTITHTANELVLSADSELKLTSDAKLRAQEATIAGDISGTGTLIFNGGRTSVIKNSGTTFQGLTQVIDRSTLNLETSGALSESDTLTIAGGATVNTRATDVFNNDIHLWFQTGENRLDIQGPQTAGYLTLPESSTIAFSSNSSSGNDQLTLTSSTENSEIRGTLLQETAGDLILDGAKATLYSQTGVAVEVKNGGELVIERENAVLGSLSIIGGATGAKITVNAKNGLNTTDSNSTLILPDNAEVTFNANQTLNKLSSNQTTGTITVNGNSTLSIANTAAPETDSLFYGELTGDGDFALTGGTLLLGGAGLSSPANTLNGAFNVTGGATLELNKDEAISGDTLTVSGGSLVTVQNGGNVFNNSLNVVLTGASDRLEIETWLQQTQRVNSLNMGADSELEIKNTRNGLNEKNTLILGADNGNSKINGTISGPGNLTISGGGTTTIGSTGQITNGLTAGDAITMINNGTISRAEGTVATTVDGSDNATADDITITNTGTIKTTGTSTGNNALYLRDTDRAQITNSGTIEANGATGIHLKLSDRANIVNSGNIIAGTDNGIFIEESTNAYVENSGKIQVAGNDGIDLEDSSNAQVINSGTISAGNNVGVNLIGSTNAALTNSGTISVTGNNGILLKGSTGAVIENSGLITANRNAIDGADADTVTNATIINSGVLRTQNQTVALNGDHTLRNSGTIEATGAGEDAIRAGNDGGTVVILEKGSRVIGGISSDSADNTLRINVGSAQSIIYETTGDWTLESLDGRPVVEGSVMTVGVGNLETVDEQMHRRSADLRDSLSRLDHQAAMAPGVPILVDAYTGQENRSAGNGSAGAGLLPAYTLDTSGLTLATELGNPDRPVRLFINYTDHALDIDNETHRIDSQGLRIGASMASLISAGPLEIGGRIAIGRNDYEGDREVLINTIGSSGVMRQEADWESDTWEVALDARYRHPLSETTTLTLTPELGIQEERIDGYTESAQFDWDSRNVMQGRAALDAALDYQASDQTRLSAALSLWYREVIDGETADYTLAGTRVSYTDPQTDGNGLSARLRFERQVSESITLAATAAGYGTNEKTDGWTFGVSLMSRF